MSPFQKSLSIKVGAVTLASMLVTLVGLSVLLAACDASASSPENPTGTRIISATELEMAAISRSEGKLGRDWEAAREVRLDVQADTGSDRITSFAVEPASSQSVVDGSKVAGSAYVVVSRTGTQVFVYTRNADGNLTDPD
jgi:hypothetical protein